MFYKLYKNKTFLFTFVVSLLLLFSININVINAQNGVGSGASIFIYPISGKAIPGQLVTIEVQLTPQLAQFASSSSNGVYVIYFPPGVNPPNSGPLTRVFCPLNNSHPNSDSPDLYQEPGIPTSSWNTINCILAASWPPYCGGHSFGNMSEGRCYNTSTNTIYINTRFIPQNPPGSPYTIAAYLDIYGLPTSLLAAAQLSENESNPRPYGRNGCGSSSSPMSCAYANIWTGFNDQSGLRWVNVPIGFPLIGSAG